MKVRFPPKSAFLTTKVGLHFKTCFCFCSGNNPSTAESSNIHRKPRKSQTLEFSLSWRGFPSAPLPPPPRPHFLFFPVHPSGLARSLGGWENGKENTLEQHQRSASRFLSARSVSFPVLHQRLFGQSESRQSSNVLQGLVRLFQERVTLFLSRFLQRGVKATTLMALGAKVPSLCLYGINGVPSSSADFSVFIDVHSGAQCFYLVLFQDDKHKNRKTNHFTRRELHERRNQSERLQPTMRSCRGLEM